MTLIFFLSKTKRTFIVITKKIICLGKVPFYNLQHKRVICFYKISGYVIYRLSETKIVFHLQIMDICKSQQNRNKSKKINTNWIIFECRSKNNNKINNSIFILCFSLSAWPFALIYLQKEKNYLRDKYWIFMTFE